MSRFVAGILAFASLACVGAAYWLWFTSGGKADVTLSSSATPIIHLINPPVAPSLPSTPPDPTNPAGVLTLPSYGGSAERLSDLRDGLTVS